MITLRVQIACVEREIERRRRFYGHIVETGRMSKRTADREIAEMEAVLATLRGLLGPEASAQPRVSPPPVLDQRRMEKIP